MPARLARTYSVRAAALRNTDMTDAQVAATVIAHGDKGASDKGASDKGASDGLEADAQNRVYVTNYEHNAILRRTPNGVYETIVHDPRALWPDTLSLARDGYLYFTANQLHRQKKFHNGQDLRQKPYWLFRIKVNATPVLLRK